MVTENAVASCPAAQRRARRLVGNTRRCDFAASSSWRRTCEALPFGYDALGVLAGRAGVASAAGDAWVPREWFAFVEEEATGRAVSVYRGERARAGDTETILYVGASSSQREPGATAWGFSQLLHRLRLGGATRAKLSDASEGLPEPVVISGRRFRTRGSLIFGRADEQRRPFAFPVAQTMGSNGLDAYSYDLTEERARAS